MKTLYDNGKRYVRSDGFGSIVTNFTCKTCENGPHIDSLKTQCAHCRISNYIPTMYKEKE